MEYFFNYLKKSRKQFNEQEKKLFQTIANKNVAIVGPSPWLNGKSLGKEIDSHDIIVRINLGIELGMNYKEDFGSRTDVLFINQKIRRDFKGNIPKEWYDKCGLKYLFILYQNLEKNVYKMYKQKLLGKDIECPVCKKSIKQTDYIDVIDAKTPDNQIVQTLVHSKCYYGNVYTNLPIPAIAITVNEFDDALSVSSNNMTFLLGLRAILHMFKYKPKKLSIYGFDFYDAVKTKQDRLNYNDIYFTGYKVLEGSFDDSTKDQTDELGHKDKSGKQLDFFKKIYEINQKRNILGVELVVDKNLYNIIHNIREEQKQESFDLTSIKLDLTNIKI